MKGISNNNMTSMKCFTPSPEQISIFDAIKSGGNHAIYGEAGTGKTSLIRFIVSELKAMGRNVLCVAPTGIATQNLGIKGAMTIHKAFRLPTGMPDNAVITSDMHWLHDIDTLVVDEISMVRSDVFSTMDRLLKGARKNDSAFGGLQIIVVGDLMQLAPFAADQNLEKYIMQKYGSLFSFKTQAWAAASFTDHKLTYGFRQAADKVFYQYLHDIHAGNIANCDLSKLNDVLIVNDSPDKANPECQLAFLKDDAMECNRRELAKLKGKTSVFNAVVDNFTTDDYPVDSTLELKMGERVLLASNGYQKHNLVYSNGDFGVFVGMAGSKLKVRLEKNGIVFDMAKRKWESYDYQLTADNQCTCTCTGHFEQFPVLPGYAITINRSQGMTLSGNIRIILPDDKRFPPGGIYNSRHARGPGWSRTRIPSGVIYTALSRAKSLTGLSCNKKIEKQFLEPHKEVKEFMEQHQLW